MEGEPSPASASSESSTVRFKPVIEAIDFDALTSLALKVRSDREGWTDRRASCDVQHPPMTGSYNIVYVLLFSDGVRWIARFPGNGLLFDALAAQRMVSDIRTAELIRSKTSIPVPETFAWQCGENAVGVPYRLEAFAEGAQLAVRWTDQSWATEAMRLTVLRNLARIMAELASPSFDRIGALHFTEDGTYTRLGPITLFKHEFTDLKAPLWTKLVARGPFESVRSLLLEVSGDMSATYLETKERELALVRLAIESIPESLRSEGKYALGHPDLNYQNIFVDDEGRITGLTDWDGVRTLPRAMAFARYPLWITRDWDPIKYGWGVPGCREEDSPEALLRYRRTYATALADLGLAQEVYSTEDTVLSHLMEAIQIAAKDIICRPGILNKLLNHAFAGDPPCTLAEYFGTQDQEEQIMWTQAIQAGFRNMWRAEWEDSVIAPGKESNQTTT